jgi:hypothetical protein
MVTMSNAISDWLHRLLWVASKKCSRICNQN